MSCVSALRCCGYSRAIGRKELRHRQSAQEERMYQFSRSIYRELSDRVLESPTDPAGLENRQRVLEACEDTMMRLAQDQRYFARPTCTLFREVRNFFALRDQVWVYKVIDANVRLATEYLAQLPNVGPFGEPRNCRACTRRGTPCQREPLPGRDYCPSHKHLEEFDVEPQVTADAANSQQVAAAA